MHHELVDPRSGVICIPNNFDFGGDRELSEGLLRVTCLANYDLWKNLPEENYRREKARCFTEHEIAYCDSKPNPPQHYAGRFAAKEAVGKALGSGVYFTWKEIEVRGRPKPGVHLHGRTARWAEKVGARQIELSMTHSRELAAAIAVATGVGLTEPSKERR